MRFIATERAGADGGSTVVSRLVSAGSILIVAMLLMIAS
jgi:hypothetical protein